MYDFSRIFIMTILPSFIKHTQYETACIKLIIKGHSSSCPRTFRKTRKHRISRQGAICRTKIAVLSMFLNYFKAHNNLAPNYICSKINMARNSHSHNTRGAAKNHLQLSSANNKFGLKTFACYYLLSLYFKSVFYKSYLINKN